MINADDAFDFDIVNFRFNLWVGAGWRCPPAYLIWGIHIYANRIFMYLCIKSSIGTKGEVS